MKLSVEPGKYVLAVSGGVDSIALLDMLARMPELDLVVAHFDHGIRPESADDAAFVQELTELHNLPCPDVGGGASVRGTLCLSILALKNSPSIR